VTHQGRQDDVPQQGKGLLATLPGDIGARKTLSPSLGAVVQAGSEEQALGTGPGGGCVPEGHLEREVDREQAEVGHLRHRILL
jgi:hypothetical protein